jgi:TRAP-type C4-dicarboxylate transport system permease small subunit
LIINQLFGGMERYIRNGQTTLFLQFPVWWAYAASFAAGVVACITAVYCAIIRIGEALKNQDILPSEMGEH